MKKVIYIVILLLFTSCTSFLSHGKDGMQQKTECMEQREKTTELNYFENPRYADKPSEFVAEDGNYICHFPGSVYEYTPPEQFRMIQRLYDEDGTLRSKTTYILRSPINNVECDRDGFITKKVNFELDVRCDTIDGMDYLYFFEKEGWYDRSTGQTAFRREPYPLNTGEFTKKVFRCFEFSYDDTTMYVQIYHIKNIPQQFLNKYGTKREDGITYLKDKNGDSPRGTLIVTYIIDITTGGTYKVDWEYIFYEE
ncbi:MAG: hypothetical protein VZQ98_04830 [Bacteroidales bacterium]|nr:hypothetical protein [Bacteroidales bacterium]